MKSDYPYIKKQKPYLMFHGIILQLWINTNEINNKKVPMKNPLFLFVFPMNYGMESVILIIKLSVLYNHSTELVKMEMETVKRIPIMMKIHFLRLLVY